MPTYTNFYENLKEAEMRLKGTVVLYDGEPYYVLCVCDHKPDGIFRIYLYPIGVDQALKSGQGLSGVPSGSTWDPALGMTRGEAMDKWLTLNPTSKIIRKMMNSPLFNKFRPFPLGMLNLQGSVYFVERHPTRKSEQGLTNSMLHQNTISLINKKGFASPDMTSAEMRATILNEYPSPQECLTKLADPEITNDSVAFNRNFALVRGPIDTLFLAYKQDVVGLLPSLSFASVKLGKKFAYTKEAVESLGLFGSVNT